MEQRKYPIYLHIASTGALYKIENDHSFIEIKTLGRHYFINSFSADILPMRNHISDLIEGDGSLEVNQDEYFLKLEKLKQDKTEKTF